MAVRPRENPSLTLATDELQRAKEERQQWCPAKWEKEIVAADKKQLTEF
jgi:hypothetical protein